MRHVSFLSIWVLGLIAAIAGPVRAAPLDDRVPQDAIVYTGWAGADALGPQYDKSNLKAIIDASSIKNFIGTQLPGLMDMAGKNDPEAPKIIAQLQTGLGVLWHHPCAFYFCPVDMTTPQNPGFRTGLICDAGADAKALADLINEKLAKDPPPPDMQLHISTDGTFVMMTIGRVESMADLQKEGTLAKAPAYIKAMAQVKQNGQAMAAYLDAEKLRAMIVDIISKGRDVPPEAKAKVGIVIQALGLDKMTQAAFLSGFDGKGWSDRSFIGVNAPRNGFMSLMDSPPLSDAILAAVPKDAAAFSAAKFDLHKLFNEARSAIAKIQPEAAQQFDQAVAMGGQMLNIDLEKDLIAAVGDEWLFYRAPGGVDTGMSTVFINKLKDGDAFAKTLDSLEKFFNEKSGAPVKVEKVTAGKIEVSAIMLLQYNVAWTVRNGYLYVSNMAGIGAAVAQVEGKLPSIAENDSYKAVMAGMPKGIRPTSISYLNPARIYPEIRNLVLGVLPLVRAQGINIPMDLLPDPVNVAEFMTPGGSVTWVDADGFHGVSNTAFPGAGAIGGQNIGSGGVAVGAVGAAILLPSLGRAREIANRTADAASLRQIAMSCNVYAADNADKMPQHLGVLLLRGDLTPKNLVSKRAETEPLNMTPELQTLGKEDFLKFAAEVDKHCDFVYLGQGMKADIDSSVVLAYEKPGPAMTEGINVAYQDGHVEFTRWPEVPRNFTATNDYLAKHNLPLVDVSSLHPEGPPRPREIRPMTPGLP